LPAIHRVARSRLYPLPPRSQILHCYGLEKPVIIIWAGLCFAGWPRHDIILHFIFEKISGLRIDYSLDGCVGALHLLYDQWMEFQCISHFPSHLPTNKCRSNRWSHYPLFKQWMLDPFPSSASPFLEPSLPCLLILTPRLCYQHAGALRKRLMMQCFRVIDSSWMYTADDVVASSLGIRRLHQVTNQSCQFLINLTASLFSHPV
jgi:hypothetical protein